jgi:hypothetical protein
MDEKPRKPFQFGLVGLISAVTGICAVLGVSHWREQQRAPFLRQSAAVQALRPVNGYEAEPGASPWISLAIGRCENVVGLSLIRGHYSDDSLLPLRDLTELRHLTLSKAFPFVHDDARITDAAIQHLLQLRKLRKLDLTGTEISQTGVARIKAALPACEVVFDQQGRHDAE